MYDTIQFPAHIIWASVVLDDMLVRTTSRALINRAAEDLLNALLAAGY